MSYLEGHLPDFAQCVISLWFRVPQESMDKAKNANTGSLFDGIIPLVVMGKNGTGQIPYDHVYPYPGTSVLFYNISGNYIAGDYNINGSNEGCSWEPLPTNPNPEYGYINPFAQKGPAPETNPTFIGVDGQGNLVVNFETGVIPTASGVAGSLESIGPGNESQAVSDYGGVFFGPANPPGSTNAWGDFVYDSSVFYFLQGPSDNRQPVYAPGGHSITRYTTKYNDISSWVCSTTGAITNTGNQSVTADAWHHLIVSLDLKPVISHGTDDENSTGVDFTAPWIDSASKLYIALDDVNYLGFDLSANWNSNGDPGEPNNEVITSGAELVAGSRAFRDELPSQTENQAIIGIPQYAMNASVIPCAEKSIGIPARATEVANIYRVEMAEFQLFVDVTLDPSIEANRRAFIDYKRDSKGNPIADKDGKIYLRPVDPKKAEKLLGKRPDILFHRSSKWIAGQNTGALGADDSGKPISAGQFNKTGKIKSYKPDPSVAPM